MSERFEKVWQHFCGLYQEHGSYRITKADRAEMKKRNFKGGWARIWKGKVFFSEGDVVLYLAKLCIEEFGYGWVHREQYIDEMFFDGQKEGEHKRDRLDIAIIDPSRYKNGADLRKAKWNVFAEVKYLPVGMWTIDVKRRVKGISYDCEKLLAYKDHCDHCYLCIIDDLRTRAGDIVELEQKYAPMRFLLCSPLSEGR